MDGASVWVIVGWVFVGLMFVIGIAYLVGKVLGGTDESKAEQLQRISRHKRLNRRGRRRRYKS